MIELYYKIFFKNIKNCRIKISYSKNKYNIRMIFDYPVILKKSQNGQ